LAATARTQLLQLVEIRSVVYTFQLRASRDARLEFDHCVFGARPSQTVEHRIEPLRALRMPRARHVGRKAWIGRYEEHEPILLGFLATLLGLMAVHSYRFRGGVARVAAWHGRHDVASIALQGTDAPPLRALERLLQSLRDAGFREVVTNALAPGASLPLVDVGFAVKGRLHLLTHTLQSLPAPSGVTRKVTKRDYERLVAVDESAFDEFWRFDSVALHEAERATPKAHLLVAPAIDDFEGYALFGRSGATGYVQRLAVAPSAQHSGLGRALLGDGLNWMRTHGATRAMVNTQEDNTRALDLYLRTGFTRLPVGLCVLGREL
jgi:GNAT superfamily N-acetyltransferase